MYLTDKQYLTLLKTIRAELDTGKKVSGYDCTDIGNKDTSFSFGLCCDDYTTLDTAMFPSEFPNRASMKYTKKYHKCPLDWRKLSEMDGRGCFYTCSFFQRGLKDKERIKKLYDDLIARVEA